jgi:cell division protein ZapA
MEEQKRKMEVIIDGKVYTLAGEESEEYMQRIASYLNSKIRELKGMPSYKKLNREFQQILLALNVSDDLYKTKEILSVLKEEYEKKEQDLYEQNQERLAEKMELETAKKLVTEYRNQMNQLQKRIMELETGRHDKT